MKKGLSHFLTVSCVFSIFVTSAASVSARDENDRKNLRARSAVEKYLERNAQVTRRINGPSDVARRASIAFHKKGSMYSVAPGNEVNVITGNTTDLLPFASAPFSFSYPMATPTANGMGNITLPSTNAWPF